MNEYKTLEEQITELWKSRGMDVERLQFHTEVHRGGRKGIWTITAPV